MGGAEWAQPPSTASRNRKRTVVVGRPWLENAAGLFPARDSTGQQAHPPIELPSSELLVRPPARPTPSQTVIPSSPRARCGLASRDQCKHPAGGLKREEAAEEDRCSVARRDHLFEGNRCAMHKCRKMPASYEPHGERGKRIDRELPVPGKSRGFAHGLTVSSTPAGGPPETTKP